MMSADTLPFWILEQQARHNVACSEIVKVAKSVTRKERGIEDVLKELEVLLDIEQRERERLQFLLSAALSQSEGGGRMAP